MVQGLRLPILCPEASSPTVQVLNVGGNQVSGKLKIQGMPKLRALIVNDNAITAVKGAGRRCRVMQRRSAAQWLARSAGAEF